MSSHNEPQVAYPPPAYVYPAETQGGFMAPPPPAGYPTKDGHEGHIQAAPTTTKSRGDGFWKGWLVLNILILMIMRIYYQQESVDSVDKNLNTKN